MAAGVELKESTTGDDNRVNGIVLDFPTNLSCDSSSSPVKIPRRVKQRLMESKSPSVTTFEDIQAKLKEADHRRQQFHEWLSSKARPKPRSPSWSSSQDDDLAQKLEAKLIAAEQKRLSILAKARKRLAKLDERRQAAKTGAELRYEKEREKLGTKVESRVQQAEENRMLLLKARRQRRAAVKERRDQSLLQRMVQESKYKECVRASICQKRAAAEKKRLGLLEAEKRRTHARLMQVKRVAKFVNHQREIERRRIKDQLEDRLQRAKSQRAEYLRQRGSLHTSVRVNWYEMHKQGDFLSRKLARCWRRFVQLKRTTHTLAKGYDALQIKGKSVKSMPFEQLAVLIESSTTIQTVKALLDRFETRFTLTHSNASLSGPSKLDNIDHLLKRLTSPKRKGRPSSSRKGGPRNKGSSAEATEIPAKVSRYPVRVVLCAYMILGHPDAVFSGHGEREFLLAESAAKFVQELEMLIKVVLDGRTKSGSVLPKQTFRSQLEAFDAAWCSYLYRFVVWKVKDARSLEEDLVRAACHLELSMMQKCKLTPEQENVGLSHDKKAIQNQVTEDQRLLREKVQHLSGDAGIKRMESALSDTRSRFFEAKENGSPMDTPVAHILSPSLPGSSAALTLHSGSDEVEVSQGSLGASQKPSRVVRSLFKDTSSSPSADAVLSTTFKNRDSRLESSSDEKLARENEMLVNEIVHENRHAFADSIDISNGDQNGFQSKVREAMENAFWDGIAESMKQDDPDYGRIIELMKEVRDGLCEMAPQSWKQEIFEAIDLDILTQVLMSGTHDMEYLGKMLQFALVALQKLSAAATEDKMKETHKNLLKDLGVASSGSFIDSMIKGLRFVLQEIQALKREISKARIKIMEPIIKGPGGLEYLKKAFGGRYGSPSNVSTSLPLTVRWLSSVRGSAEEEWEEHKDSLAALMASQSSTSQGLPPSTALKTGGKVPTSSNKFEPTFYPQVSTTGGQPECKGEKIDVLVRLGLLKLVSKIEGINNENLPETLKLNFSRLRSIQSQLQKIIVISTSMLVLRQSLLSKSSYINPSSMEYIVTNSVKAVTELLDSVEDVGIIEIVEKFYEFMEGSEDAEKLQASKEVMANMLLKSLRAGDPVFERVSLAVYVAVRSAVLGGTVAHGRNLAETVLRRVGAAVLVDRVIEIAEVLIIVAKVSGSVHGEWYLQVVNNV
ncbi:uncharacterized protein LOC113306647 [Papaver somniferum]|uniref:uncharacterized protein LOC113306647 n=1 Tax=Papaver somniferum TaxID=3469 RepID=UPI000E6FF4D0|nr:uncharacterized protein LOC113306647 [Papaver somniferum]